MSLAAVPDPRAVATGSYPRLRRAIAGLVTF